MTDARQFFFEPCPPFSFKPSLHFIKLGIFIGGSTSVGSGGTLLHAARIGGAAVRLTVRAETQAGIESGEESEHLCCAAAMSSAPGNDTLCDANEASVREYLDHYLSLSADLIGFYALAQKDKRFAAQVLPKLYGYHPVKFPTPLESMVWAVLSQATPQTIARKLMAAVTSAYGDAVQIEGAALTAFPAAQTLIDTPKGALRDLIANERKAKTIQAAARALQAADPAWLRDAPTEYMESWLREIPGIGAWSSSLILVRGFGRMDAITADSLAGAAGEAFLTAAKRVYGPRFTAVRLAAMLENYGPYAGYWLHYLRAGLAR